MVIVPVLLILPARPGFATMPAELFDPVIWIRPSFLTLSLLSIVIAFPLAGLTEPVEEMRTSSLPVLVSTGVVIAVLMSVSALAIVGSKANDRGVKQVAASSLRIQGSSGWSAPPGIGGASFTVFFWGRGHA